MGLLRPPGETITRADRVRIVTAPGRYDDRHFERLDPKTRKGFLARVPEPGQTAEEFAKEEAGRHPRHRRAIRFVPCSCGEPAPARALLGALTRYVDLAFPGASGEIGPTRPIPEDVLDQFEERADAERLLDELLPLVSVDVLALIGLAGAGLFSGPRDSVGTQASFRRRVSVISLPFQAEGATPELFLRRMLGAVAHDVGHVLGMAHCVFYRCAMNGAASADELDGRPLLFCPVCEEKIGVALGPPPDASEPDPKATAGGPAAGDPDPASKEKRLRAFFRENGLVLEAEVLEKRLRDGRRPR